jgi:hypothetical protein
MPLNYLFRINLKSNYPCFSIADFVLEKDGQSQSFFRMLQDDKQKNIKTNKEKKTNLFFENIVLCNRLSKILICF